MRITLFPIVVGVALVACVDLLHSTDIAAVCDETPGYPPCFDHNGRSDFCAWSTEEARANAEHACTWLGACEGVLESNAFGTCMANALRVFDCGTSTERASGLLRDKWDCLRLAANCRDVDRCGRGLNTIAPCAAGSEGTTRCVDDHTHVICGGEGTPATIEDCALLGRSCGVTNGISGCKGTCAPVISTCGRAVNDCKSTCVDSVLTGCAPDGTAVKADCSGAGLTCGEGAFETIRCVTP